MKFRLKQGIYKDLKGRVYKKNDVIETDIDLIEAFPLKFEKVGGLANAPDNDSMVTSESTPSIVQANEGEKETGKGKKSKKDDKSSTDLGEEVTGEFEEAQLNDLVVFKREGVYVVYEKDDQVLALNKKEKLSTPEEATAFIKKTLGIK